MTVKPQHIQVTWTKKYSSPAVKAETDGALWGKYEWHVNNAVSVKGGSFLGFAATEIKATHLVQQAEAATPRFHVDDVVNWLHLTSLPFATITHVHPICQGFGYDHAPSYDIQLKNGSRYYDIPEENLAAHVKEES